MKARSSSIPSVDKDMDELERVIERVKALGAAPEDSRLLEDLVASYAYITDLVRDKQTTIQRLRKMLFGETSEKKEKVFPQGEGGAASGGTPSEGEGKPEGKPGAKAKGHGRNGAGAYPGAKREKVPHTKLRPGDPCPHCKGKLYAREPRRLVRVRAAAPFSAVVYEQEELRCNLCGEVFAADLPEGVGEEKHDATVASLLAVLRYGSGLPLNRIAALQEGFGIPLPVSTQWDLLARAARVLVPAHDELLRLAAQGEVVHNDDTPMTILEYLKEREAARERGDASERTGVFTTGVVSTVEGRRIALYATGPRHAGENLRALLLRRDVERAPPVQMCDGLERNLPRDLETIVGNCVVHMRRHFVEVAGSFPDEVRHVLDELACVYRTEARAKALPPTERLALHQRESAPVMERLRAWMDEQEAERRVEPNSGLGKAIAYAKKRWGRLTLFLRVEGAPLDNNVCERMLKRAILHRKNSLFYKTSNGARVGDLFMSLVATAKLSRVDPSDYLTALQRHATEVAQSPSSWMPWSYRETLARLREGAAAVPPSALDPPSPDPPA
jgi:transposase